MGKFRAERERGLVYVPQKKAGSKAQASSFTGRTTVKGTNTAFQKDGLHLPREPLLPKSTGIL